MTVFEQVRTIVAEVSHVSVEEVTPETNLEDVLDSPYASSEVIICVEERFGIIVSRYEADEIETVADFVAFLYTKGCQDQIQV